MEKIRTLSILGPTGSGKTALAVEMASRLGGQVISCDSMQLYKYMDIGTASATEEEKKGIVHRLISVKEPEEEFSAAEYAEMAREAIADTVRDGMLPVICGGTGLYHDSIMRISGFEKYASDEKLRQELYDLRRPTEMRPFMKNWRLWILKPLPAYILTMSKE